MHIWHRVKLVLPCYLSQKESTPPPPPFVVEITPCGYLSASCNAADKSWNPVVKDNSPLTCPALSLCSHTINVIPKVLGGSFSMFMTRNKKMKSCTTLGNLQKPGRGWLSPEQFVRSKGTSEASFKNKKFPVLIPTGLLVIIIAIWTKLSSPKMHLCSFKKYDETAALINIDDKSQKGLYLLQYVLFLTGDILYFPISSLWKYTCIYTALTSRKGNSVPSTVPLLDIPFPGPWGN